MAANQGHRNQVNSNAPRHLLLLPRLRLLQSFFMLSTFLSHTHPGYSSPVDSPSLGIGTVGAVRTARATTDGGVGDFVGIGSSSHIFQEGPSSDGVLVFGEEGGLVGPGGLEELDPLLLIKEDLSPLAGSQDPNDGGQIPDSLGPEQQSGLIEIGTKPSSGDSPAGDDGRIILGNVFGDPLSQVIKNVGGELGVLSDGKDPLFLEQVDPEGRGEVPVGGIPGSTASPSISTGDPLAASAFIASGGKSSFLTTRDVTPLTGAHELNESSFFRRTGVPTEASVSRTAETNDAGESNIRLVDGEGSHEGSVQVLMDDGRWVHVCDDNFDFLEADVVCRQLGFAGAARFTRNDYFRPASRQARRATEFWPYTMTCTSGDSDYFHCAKGEAPDCGASEVAGVECWRREHQCRLGAFECSPRGLGTCIARAKVCNGNDDCADGSDEKEELCGDVGVIRLVDAEETPRGVSGGGVVYVKRRGVWGTICDRFGPGFFENGASQVFCRSLGFDRGFGIKVDHGQGSGSIHIDSSHCFGREESIESCDGFSWGVNNCSHSEDIGLVCSDPLEARLSLGTGPDNGVLELKVSNIWQTVSNQDFDYFDAKVVCRMLGYEVLSPLVSHLPGSNPKNHLPFYWDCEGHEKRLEDCYSWTLRTAKRQVADAVTVNCSSAVPSPSPLTVQSSGQTWECGREANSSDLFLMSLAKVSGGVRKRVHQIPWMVLISSETDPNYYCNGVILDTHHVLTTTHCLEGRSPLPLRLHVGGVSRNHASSFEDVYYVEKYVLHPDYEYAARFDNDISMIYVHDKDGHGIRFRPHIRPACLPNESDAYKLMEKCDISGWSTAWGPYRGTVHLQTTAFCVYRQYPRKIMTSGMVCAGSNYTRVDTCPGDSGGPLTCQFPDGRNVLMGLASWGKECSLGEGGLYTRITKFLPWIRRHMTT